MKYIIYELFSGVGFCNQLFSLESAIYLANITNRKLILLIKSPLCHCGKASWNYGHFLELFSDDYKTLLPCGIDVYYKIIPEHIQTIMKTENTNIKNIDFRFSSNVFVESAFKDNISDIDNFCNGRNKIIIDFDKIENEYLYITGTNASRCFYNYYTSKERYSLMSKICFSLTHLNKLISEKCNTNINVDKDHIFELAIHLRLGDYHRSIDDINKHSINYCNTLMNIIDNIDISNIVIMCDRKDGDIIDILKQKYHVTFTDELITTTNNPVIDFLIQKSICEKSKYFIGTQGSTVSNYINYSFYLQNKSYNYYTKREMKIYNNNYSWCSNNIMGHPISWSIFWDDNIDKVNMLTSNFQMISHNSRYIKIVREININPEKNKKIISFCLYGLNNERNNRRYFDKGVYVNYHYMKTKYYKDWTMRVYIPYNEPTSIIDNIKSFGDIEIILVDTNTCLRALRFLPNDDPNVKIWISRDLDSVLNSREEKAVEDWLNNRNDKELMIMSDHPQHTWTIAAGMFGKINTHNNDIAQYILEWCNSNSNSNCYDCDARIAEGYFYKESNYIQYYRAGKKLDNSIPFPDLSNIHCNFVGNISPILKYYTDLQLDKVYPFLSSKSDIKENNLFLYNPWKCHFKTSEPICSMIWKDDDVIMTIDPKKETGLGTWKTLNGDGKKLLELNRHIQILWEGKKYIEAYMPNKETISVKHGEIWYNFNKTKFNNNISKTNKIKQVKSTISLNKNNIFPLSYSIPRECVKPVNLIQKNKEFATVIPGKSNTYIFKNSSKDYNEDYEKSKFAFTYKKGGWDCLRHYEILCNNCLPLFLDIDECPEMTMHNFPKSIMKNILSDYTNKLIDNTKYSEYINELHNYTLKHLTCEAQAEYLLNILKKYKNIDEPKILMITSGLLNYSTSTIAYGLRKKLNTNFIDYPKIKHIYKSNVKEIFNISLLEEDSIINRNDIHSKIENKYFDFIIFGAIGPDEPDLLDKINRCTNYNSNEKIFIFGGDRPFNIKVENKTSDVLAMYSNMGLCFVRELDNNGNYFFDGKWCEYVKEWTNISHKKIRLTQSYKINILIPNIKIDFLSKKTELCEIGRKYDTDKSAWRNNVNNRRHCHPYTPVYDILFDESKHYSLNIMEIGIAYGSSLLMWREYFECSNIYALEYRKDHIEDFRKNFDNTRIKIDEVDVRQQSSIRSAFLKYQDEFDIIIDDSTHEFKDQVLIIKTVIPFLKPGGILVIEDIFKNIKDIDFFTKIEKELENFKEYYFIEPEHINRNSYNWNNDKLLVLVKKGGTSLFEKYNKLSKMK